MVFDAARVMRRARPDMLPIRSSSADDLGTTLDIRATLRPDGDDLLRFLPACAARVHRHVDATLDVVARYTSSAIAEMTRPEVHG